MSRKQTQVVKGSTAVNAKVNLALANGTTEEIDYTLPYAFKSGTDSRVVSRVCTLAMQMYKEYEAISTGYFKLVPLISNVLSEESWKELEGCRGINQFVESVTGCSKSSASEMIKVAKAFYTSGKLDNGFELFSYTELVKLAGCEEEVREAVRDRIAALGGKAHTRKEMLEILKDEQAKALEAKNNEQFGDETANAEEGSESEQENAADAPKVETEQEGEPLEDDTVEEMSEWDNVSDTIEFMNFTTLFMISKTREIALNANMTKADSKTALLELTAAITDLVNSDYDYDAYEGESPIIDELVGLWRTKCVDSDSAAE